MKVMYMYIFVVHSVLHVIDQKLNCAARPTLLPFYVGFPLGLGQAELSASLAWRGEPSFLLQLGRGIAV